MQKKIAIQGFPGSFHHMAANEYFGPGIEPVCSESFPGLIRAMTTDPSDMEFSAPGDWDKILTQLTSMVSEIEVYGLYKSATFQLK